MERKGRKTVKESRDRVRRKHGQQSKERKGKMIERRVRERRPKKGGGEEDRKKIEGGE